MLKKQPKYTAETHTHTHTLSKSLSSLSLQLSSFFSLLLCYPSVSRHCLSSYLSLHIISALDSFHHLSPPRSHSSSRYLEIRSATFSPPSLSLSLSSPLFPSSSPSFCCRFVSSVPLCMCVFLLTSQPPLLSRSSKCDLLSL